MKRDNLVLTLDDGNQYVVVQNVILEGKEYLYLSDINHISKIMFCELKESRLIKVNDFNLIQRLMKMLKNNL